LNAKSDSHHPKCEPDTRHGWGAKGLRGAVSLSALTTLLVGLPLKGLTVSGTFTLSSDQADYLTYGLIGGNLNLNGYTFTLPSIYVGTNEWARITEPGKLTSFQEYINIGIYATSRTGGTGALTGLSIESVIADSDHKVGLSIYGSRPMEGVVYLKGAQSNTFTGDVHLSGASNYLALGKTNGAIAVQGNIWASSGSVLRLDGSNQISDNSIVTLSGATFYYSPSNTVITEKIHQLVIDQTSRLSFDNAIREHPNRYLYLDDLSIKGNATLTVRFWSYGRDFLLVRKDSQNLANALGRIQFEGYTPGNWELKDFNSDYWSITPFPEPGAYGAILGAVGAGLLAYRRKRQA